MACNTSISIFDLSSSVGATRVTAGHSWTIVGGPEPEEGLLDGPTADLTGPQVQNSVGTPVPFQYAIDLWPAPHPIWDTAIWLQEIGRIGTGDGWLFRSGRYQSEIPSQPIDIIVAPEFLVDNAMIAGAMPALPFVTGSTTVTSISTSITGADIAVVATGTDTALPPGDTFTLTCTLSLVANGSVQDTDEPFLVRMNNVNFVAIAGPGAGFSTAIINLFADAFIAGRADALQKRLQSLVNSAVLDMIATRINRGTPTSMPAGVILSIRRIRAATMADGSPAIGISGALGAFDGVTSKFPPSSNPNPGPCFIATAAAGEYSSEVAQLRHFRDKTLRCSATGTRIVEMYQRMSPPIAANIARSRWRRKITLVLIVKPAAWLSKLFQA